MSGAGDEKMCHYCERIHGDDGNCPPREKVVTYASGMNRSDDTGKPRYDLLSMLMLRRWAEHMAKNVASKGDGNWRKASTQEDIDRCKASAFRHFMAWFNGEEDEDHAAALMFGIGVVEETKEKMPNRSARINQEV